MELAPAYGIQYPYLVTLDLTISEHFKVYNKKKFGLPESDRYDLTRSKWTDFYQKKEYSVFRFVFKAVVLIVSTRYVGHAPT